jgi:hypothetical protein
MNRMARKGLEARAPGLPAIQSPSVSQSNHILDLERACGLGISHLSGCARKFQGGL